VRSALFILLSLLMLAGCGDDGGVSPDVVDDPPGDAGPFPLDIRFINNETPGPRAVGIKALITMPGEGQAADHYRNWQQPAAGASFTLAVADSVPAGTVVQVWYVVLDFWSEYDVDARWRAWSAGADTVEFADEAVRVFTWPEDRWYYDEVPWPPLTNGPGPAEPAGHGGRPCPVP
jgi:hypothetical protein